jgi:hypothetical protein
MEWPVLAGRKQRYTVMPFHLTREGVVNIRREDADSAEAEAAWITSAEEWERIAGEWPLKRLVEIWNSLPGVAAVRKFTSRPIALRRIWRALESPEPDTERQNRPKSQKANFREGSKAASGHLRFESSELRLDNKNTCTAKPTYGFPKPGPDLIISLSRRFHGMGIHSEIHLATVRCRKPVAGLAVFSPSAT